MNKKRKHKIGYYLTLIILLVVLYFAYQFYQTNNFNDFVRGEALIYTSEFKRDSEVKYGEKRSYKIESNEYNDAMFYKRVKVKKNYPYKIKCMVKTNNIEAEEQLIGVGAQISIEGTTEKSESIVGTNDWQELELMVNSKNREELTVGFRLGGYLGKAKGEAWFSDFSIEEGTENTDNNWQFACFIFTTTDVNIDGKEVKIQVTQDDIKDIRNTINLFESSCKNLSQGKMTAECHMYTIDTPLSKLSYDEQFGYYVSADDVEDQIKDTIAINNYDHIFVIVRLRR